MRLPFTFRKERVAKERGGGALEEHEGAPQGAKKRRTSEPRLAVPIPGYT